MHQFPPRHAWQVTIAIQQQLRQEVIREDAFGDIRYVAGIDVGFDRHQATLRAAVVVLRFPNLGVAQCAVANRPADFPYKPGLLSFREAPAALEALSNLTILPDLLICDGHGYAHPRRFGLACHLGVLTGIPSMGVAKTRLVGQHQAVADERGAWQPLTEGGEVVGAVLRARAKVKPVYVSVGHRISLTSAIEVVLRCTPRYRLPETTRQAHSLASGRTWLQSPGDSEYVLM